MRTTIAITTILVGLDANAASLVVTSFADSGAGTLRQALTTAINNDEWDSISFASSGTVGLTSPLPAIDEPPSCQKGMTCSLHINNGGTYDIVIDGSAIPRPNADAHGLRIFTSDVWIWDLTISGFEQTGVWIDGADTESVNVRGCRIGTDSSGTNTTANTVVGDAGIRVTGGAYSVYLYDNVIGGYVSRAAGWATGVHIDSNNLGERPQPVWLQGNIIGLTADGTAPLSGSGSAPEVGIHLHDTVRNHIGDSDNMNTIGNQALAGILVTGNATTNYVNYNRVGTDITGTVAMPNGTSDPDTGGGIVVQGPSAGGQFIGNLVSGNANCQIRFDNSSNRPTLTSNLIGPAAGEPTVPLSLSGGGTFAGNVNGVCINDMDAQVSDNVIAFHNPALACPPECGAAVLIQGNLAYQNMVSGNFMGVALNAGAVVGAAPNHYGILMLNGPSATDVWGNTIANNGQAGIAVVGASTDRNHLRYNDLDNNGTDRSENVEICLASTLTDCINHGYVAGSGRGNLGLLPPTFDSDLFTAPATVEPTAMVSVTGSAAEGSVSLFRVPSTPAGGGQGGSADLLQTIVLDASPYEFQFDITLATDSHHCLTAVYIDPTRNTSELAPNVRALFGASDAYGAGPCRPPWTPPAPDGGPADGEPTDGAPDGNQRDGGEPGMGDPISVGDPTSAGDPSTGDGYVLENEAGPNPPPPCSPGFEREDGQCVRRLSCSASTGSGLAVLFLLLATVRARRERR